ncbi:alpha/beta hydrolase [Roseobacter sp. HKCCA0434]|uniref:alpha/beta fold hydrolase n=1 Tax=Roseobacter sp. HKCCA0434 TaxID=3079297 RepID=UPI0029057FBA|nr:alpha/beta hydrolase [Roseobacter sp. HKCCA0434]
MRTLTLGGAETGVMEAGDSGPRLILSHCTMAHSGAWKPLLAELGAVQATALDLPGHGASEMDATRGPQRQGADAVLEVLGEGPAHLIGHSFGGRVVLRAALDRPEAVASLTLIEPMMMHLLAEDDPVRLAEERDMQAYAEAETEAEAARAFMEMWGGGQPWEALPERQRAYATERIGFVADSAEDVMGDPPGQMTLDDIAGLDCPVTVIAGARTRASALSICERIAGRLSDRPHIVAGAGHMVPISHPAEVAAILRERLG